MSGRCQSPLPEAPAVNQAQLVPALVCVGAVLLVVLGFEVFIFRLSCLICRVPQPGLFRSFGTVSVLLLVPAVVDAVFGAGLAEAYRAGGYPLWEAGLVQFFLALPAHMAICSVIHAHLLNLKVGEGLAVWFVDKLLKAVVLLTLVGGVALLVVLGRLKG